LLFRLPNTYYLLNPARFTRVLQRNQLSTILQSVLSFEVLDQFYVVLINHPGFVAFPIRNTDSLDRPDIAFAL
jgi:hypothetical protein